MLITSHSHVLKLGPLRPLRRPYLPRCCPLLLLPPAPGLILPSWYGSPVTQFCRCRDHPLPMPPTLRESRPSAMPPKPPLNPLPGASFAQRSFRRRMRQTSTTQLQLLPPLPQPILHHRTCHAS